MSPFNYNPKLHHRQSIRLKGHNYAGGGVYFVTICAHREFSAWALGRPFSGLMKQVVEERLRITEEKFPDAQWFEWVIMPDHFHALIHIEGGHARLGDIIGGFKSAVSREFRRAQKKNSAFGATQAKPVRARPASPSSRPASPSFAGKIWHRNYYEMIVRSPGAEEKISHYIQMNPWRCVQQFAAGLRGMGNPALWHLPKTGVLCSRNAPCPSAIPAAPAYFSGFHSPLEKQIFERLLEHKRPLIWCPAWGLDRAASDPAVRRALEENRMLVLEMSNAEGDLAAAEARTRFVIQQADTLWTPHVNPGGMIDRLLSEKRTANNNE